MFFIWLLSLLSTLFASQLDFKSLLADMFEQDPNIAARFIEDHLLIRNDKILKVLPEVIPHLVRFNFFYMLRKVPEQSWIEFAISFSLSRERETVECYLGWYRSRVLKKCLRDLLNNDIWYKALVEQIIYWRFQEISGNDFYKVPTDTLVASLAPNLDFRGLIMLASTCHTIRFQLMNALRSRYFCNDIIPGKWVLSLRKVYKEYKLTRKRGLKKVLMRHPDFKIFEENIANRNLRLLAKSPERYNWNVFSKDDSTILSDLLVGDIDPETLTLLFLGHGDVLSHVKPHDIDFIRKRYPPFVLEAFIKGISQDLSYLHVWMMKYFVQETSIPSELLAKLYSNCALNTYALDRVLLFLPDKQGLERFLDNLPSEGYSFSSKQVAHLLIHGVEVEKVAAALKTTPDLIRYDKLLAKGVDQSIIQQLKELVTKK